MLLDCCTWNSYGNQVAVIVTQPLMGEARVRSNRGESERFYSLPAAARYILSNNDCRLAPVDVRGDLKKYVSMRRPPP